MTNYSFKEKLARELIKNFPFAVRGAKARQTTATLSKRLGVTNNVLVRFLAQKHPELGITDPLKHHGKSFSWHPEAGHTMEEEIGAELKVFFQEHPELDGKTKSEKALETAPVSPILAPASVPPVLPKTPGATPAPRASVPMPPPVPAVPKSVPAPVPPIPKPVPATSTVPPPPPPPKAPVAPTAPAVPLPVARPIAPISKRGIKSLFRRHKEQPWNEVFAKLQYVNDGDFDRPFRELANLAENELWNFEREEFRNKYDEFYILKNYLNYTFLRVLEQDRIVFSEDHKRFCFNTGLLTKRGKDIYASFFFQPKNGLPEWTLWGFTDEFERLPVPSTKLPPPASYYEGSEAVNLVFDLSYEIAIDFEHILEENKERFPEKYRDDAILEYALKGAVASLKERIRRNYKIAIPHWYNNKLQLLLPLSLSGSGADLALVADRNDETKLYKIVTVLTMDMAYIDARLICRPDKEWLNP